MIGQSQYFPPPVLAAIVAGGIALAYVYLAQEPIELESSGEQDRVADSTPLSEVEPVAETKFVLTELTPEKASRALNGFAKYRKHFSETELYLATTQRVIIENDGGGLPAPYINRLIKQEAMEIRGYCASSCTIYLANPNACLHPQAVLLFHAPSIDYHGSKPVVTRKPTGIERRATKELMKYYPLGVKRWIKKNGGLKVTLTDMLALRGDELSALVRTCPTAPRVLYQTQTVNTDVKGNLAEFTTSESALKQESDSN
jgi:hypothetical protein